MRTYNVLHLIIGILGLVTGTFLYLVARPPEEIYFIYTTNYDLSLFHSVPNLFGKFSNWLPTFLHPFSFILLTAGIITFRRRNYITICLFWFAVNVLFELAQKYKTFSTAIIPEWFSGIPYLENSQDYFQNGVFDYFDLIAIALGAIAAYFILLFTERPLIKICD